MGSILELKKKLEKVTQPKIQKAIAKVILESPELKRAKIEELKEGLRPDGNIIGVYRSLVYASQKQQQNPKAGGTVDLILTGSFTDKMFLKNSSPSVFLFESTDTKADDLFSKYGNDLKGLNAETFRDIEILFLKKEYIKAIKDLIR